MIRLRDYQIKARDRVIEEWDKGNLNTLVASSTGSGKTEVGLSVLAEDLGNGRCIWISHRRELIFQPRSRVLDHWPMLGRPGVVMANQDEFQAQFIVATIQTLKGGRLDRVLSAGTITHLVTDEAHHSTAATYQALYECLREHNPDLRHLGLTATPRRTDGTGLTMVYDSVAYRIGIKRLIASGHLCPFTAIGFALPVSLAGVRETRDGWDQEETGRILAAENAEELIIAKWREHAETRPTIAFTSSVAQAYSLAMAFREAGYDFQAIDATTKKAHRDDLLRRFKAGDVQGIVNVGILTEGFDAPHASCLVNAAPTRSDLVYVQRAGRILRICEGKQDALILDFAPQDARDMRLAGDLLGKPKEQRDREEKAQKEGIIGAFGISSEGNGIDGDPDEIILKILDYLSGSPLSWYFQGRIATATLGKGTALAVALPDEECVQRLAKANGLRGAGQWKDAWNVRYQRVKLGASYRLFLDEKPEDLNTYRTQLLGHYSTWENVNFAAEDVLSDRGLNTLSRRDAAWRRKEATEGQQRLLRKLAVWDALAAKGKVSRGIAGKAITHALTTGRLRRKGLI